jgi:hypothetical protein
MQKTRANLADTAFGIHFIDALLNALYTANRHGNCKLMPPANQKAQIHQWKQFPKRGYCVWCEEHLTGGNPKDKS